MTGLAYVPESPVLSSGTTVVFSTVEETSHPTVESDDPFESCFFAPVGYGAPPAEVLFEVVGGDLYATSAPGSPTAVASRCATATETATGSFVLRYHCGIHPWMRSAFVVEPAG